MRLIDTFFYKKNVYEKISLKTQKTKESVKKICDLKCLSCNFQKLVACFVLKLFKSYKIE